MKSHPLFEKLRIFAPGPTPVPNEVLATLSLPPLHHRTKEFGAILDRVKKGLQTLIQTKEPVTVLSSSGTGAMEAAIVNSFKSSDEVIVVQAGKFGERWAKLASRYGLKVHLLEVEWGRAVDPDQVSDLLARHPQTQGVLFQASETSTGVIHPVKEIAKAVRNKGDALVIVDGITGLGVFEMPMDAWDLDIVVGGSQKALMLPPGLAFIALSQRAKARRATANLPRFYFDLNAEDKAALTGQTAWTPAVGLICGLEAVLKRIEAVGLPTLFSFYERLAHATRTGAQAAGVEVFAKSPSPSVTALCVPKTVTEGGKIVSFLRDRFGITIAGGQDSLKGKIFRIGHLGFYDELDVLTVLAAVEIALNKLGHRCELGKGVGAAAAYLSESAHV